MELLFLGLLFWKHAFVDLPLQRQLGPINKFNYLSGHLHYLQHGVGTFIVAFPFFTISTVILITLIDYVAHWHIDFLKHRVSNNKYYLIQVNSTSWWWLTAVDQGLHFSTYIFIYYFFAN